MFEHFYLGCHGNRNSAWNDFSNIPPYISPIMRRLQIVKAQIRRSKTRCLKGGHPRIVPVKFGDNLPNG